MPENPYYCKPSFSSSLLGCDYPGVRFQVLVDQGARVEAGQAVVCDRRRPDVQFNSPVGGVVSAINRGPRRSLISCQIRKEGNQDGVSVDIPASLNKDSIRSLLLNSGLWPALRSRPFGYLADPGAEPEALLVTAIDTQPFAPEPSLIISRFSEEFSTGLKLLCDLVDSPVYLCKSPGWKFESGDSMRLKLAEFDGPHPAGLVGRHIHALCPVRFDGNQIWHIGYQDVISLGHLLNYGKPWHQRVVSLAGSAVSKPGLIAVPLGADIMEIVEGELVDKPAQILSGPALSGRDVSTYQAALGRYHNQITANLDSTATAPENRLFDSDGSNDPLIAVVDLDALSPPGILATPLLRSLLVGDVERARDLGALELVEEDLALLSNSCTTRMDYGRLLRSVLDQIDREGLSIRN